MNATWDDLVQSPDRRGPFTDVLGTASTGVESVLPLNPLVYLRVAAAGCPCGLGPI